VLLAVATPVGEIVVSASGHHILDVRSLAASWPYLALFGAMAVTGLRRELALTAGVLAVVAFSVGAATMLHGRYSRPDIRDAASFIASTARPGDVVVDETGALSPGPLTALDVTLDRPLRVFRGEAPAERDHPYGFADPIIPLQSAVNQAVRAAHGHRVFLVTTLLVPLVAELQQRLNPTPSRLPASYRLALKRTFPGLGHTLVAMYTGPSAASS
jgi:hypothetical protein